MKKIIVLWLVAVLGLTAQAQAQTLTTAMPSGSVTQATPDAERARINAERAQLEAGFAREDAVCHKKFFVNNCLDEVKIRRNDALADLKRQEISLDQQDRKARGAEQIRKTEEKASLEKQQEAADKRASALKDFDARMEREKQKNADRLKAQSNEKANSDAAAGRIKSNQEKAGERASKQAGSAEEVRKFNERIEKAKERQAQHDRDEASRTKPPSKSLPTPD